MLIEPALIDIAPLMLFSGSGPSLNWWSPTAEAVDAHGYTDAALYVYVHHATFAGQPIELWLQTAQENRDERYITLRTLTIDSSVTPPYAHMVYLTGAGESTGAPPGALATFGRFLRIGLELYNEQQEIVFDAKLLLRARTPAAEDAA